jgi:NADH-quinone oxidoreductase subunit G
VKLFKDEKDTKGRIIMSCMTQAADGMRISIDDPEARAFRAGIIEWLMVNHPHDCPVCDEGGECHLQDMTVMSGHVYRGYRFTKRTHRNQDLGAFLNHEMNRCIQCYRCVRFYRDYAGGRDFEVQGCHDNVYFGRSSDGALENEFSGNLAEVCPTGVFTDKTLKAHYSRKWDLRTAPSVCVHCGVGCNTTPGERYGILRRIRPRYNGEVNGYFLCDRGRFGYEFVNGGGRIRGTLLRKGADLSPVPPEEALAKAAEAMRGVVAVGIGSTRASLETNFALRSLVGAENFFLGVPDTHLTLLRLMADTLRESPAPSASIKDARESDAGIVLGEDVWNTAPILALNMRQAARSVPAAEAMRQKRINRWDDTALREAIRGRKGPFFIATPEPTGLDDSMARAYRSAPQEIARLGFAIAHEIDPSAPSVPSLADDEKERAALIAGALKGASRPLVVCGAGLGSIEIIHAAANLARALKIAGSDARLSLVFPDANSFGAALLARGGLEAAGRAIGEKGARALVVAEADIFRNAPASFCSRLLGSVPHLIALDHSMNPTVEKAGIILPTASFAESSGTLVSSEGRAQRFFAVFPPPSTARDCWRWLGEIAHAAGLTPRGWESLDEVIYAIATEIPDLAGIKDAAPGTGFLAQGMRIPRDPHRTSGRTSMYAHIDVREPKPPSDADSPMAYTMEGLLTPPPPALIPRFWSPGWNSDQSMNRFQIEVGGPLRGGDPGTRLFEPRPGAAGRYFTEVPGSFTPSVDSILLVSRHHTFGSEELSGISAAIRTRVPLPYIALCAEDAKRLRLEEGGSARIFPADSPSGEIAAATLTVVIREMPRGIGSVPYGVPGMPWIALPIRVKVTP